MLRLFLVLASAATAVLAAAPRPLDLAAWRGKRLLVITAHPDDAEGFSGGLIARAVEDHGVEAAYLIVTSGNAGGRCYNTTGARAFYDCEKEELAFVRRRESKTAAAFLGVENVWRLGLGDGMSVAAHETRVRRALTAYVRHFKPHIIISHSPQPDWDAPPTCNGVVEGCLWDDLGYHPDHQHVGQLVYTTVYGGGSAGDNDLVFGDLAIAAGLEKWKPEQLYFCADRATHDPFFGA